MDIRTLISDFIGSSIDGMRGLFFSLPGAAQFLILFMVAALFLVVCYIVYVRNFE